MCTSTQQFKSNIALDAIQYFIPVYGHLKVARDVIAIEEFSDKLPATGVEELQGRVACLKIARTKARTFVASQGVLSVILAVLTGFVSFFISIAFMASSVGPVCGMGYLDRTGELISQYEKRIEIETSSGQERVNWIELNRAPARRFGH